MSLCIFSAPWLSPEWWRREQAQQIIFTKVKAGDGGKLEVRHLKDIYHEYKWMPTTVGNLRLFCESVPELVYHPRAQEAPAYLAIRTDTKDIICDDGHRKYGKNKFQHASQARGFYRSTKRKDWRRSYHIELF